LTTGLQNSYANPSGTSLAAPHVTGALALLLSVDPDLSVDEQEQLLLQTAHDLGTVGPDNDYGYGLIDVWAAFQQLKGEQSPAYDWFFFLPFLSTGESIN
jgi:subtilisin family serine protease